MKVHAGLFAGLPAALLLAGSAIHAARQEPQARWNADWESARVAARQAKKPLFVVFR